MDVDLLLDARVELGEGPIWDPARGSLTWVDQLGGRVHRLTLDGVAGPAIEIGGRVGAALPAADRDGLVLTTDAGFARVDDGGRLEPLASVAVDAPYSFINDGKCDALGRLWAGSIGVAGDGVFVRGAGSLYRLDPGGGVAVARTGLSLANGMDWSPDGRAFYFIDSVLGGIDAHAFDLEAGVLGPPHRVVDIDLDIAVGFADGMCVDADGGIWTAVWGAGEVRRYTPAGVLDRAIGLPVTQPTSCTFAGPGLDVLVITSAWHRLEPGERARQPHAGSVFCCRPGAAGLATHPFGAPAGRALSGRTRR
jgi:sugar lactone lactonase YvrE